jgi:hypothetical protein
MHTSGMPIHRLKSDVTLLFLLSCGDLTRVQLFLILSQEVQCFFHPDHGSANRGLMDVSVLT